MSRRRGWTCRRVAGGVPCRHFNTTRARVCAVCRKPRPVRKRPAHMAALELDHSVFLACNGGVNRCAICDRPPASRRLDRDHDHLTGRPRGLLCHRCNRTLASWLTPDWLRRAAAYLEDRS